LYSLESPYWIETSLNPSFILWRFKWTQHGYIQKGKIGNIADIKNVSIFDEFNFEIWILIISTPLFVTLKSRSVSSLQILTYKFQEKFGVYFFLTFWPMVLPGLAWACLWPKMAKNWVKMNSPEHDVNRKVVDNGLIHLNVKYERIL